MCVYTHYPIYNSYEYDPFGAPGRYTDVSDEPQPQVTMSADTCLALPVKEHTECVFIHTIPFKVFMSMSPFGAPSPQVYGCER